MITTQVYGGGYARSGGTSTEDTVQGGHTVVTDGTISIRIESTGDGSRSFWVEADPRYADLDMTCDAPLRYHDAVAYWTEWLEGRSTPVDPQPAPSSQVVEVVTTCNGQQYRTVETADVVVTALAETSTQLGRPTVIHAHDRGVEFTWSDDSVSWTFGMGLHEMRQLYRELAGKPPTTSRQAPRLITTGTPVPLAIAA